MNKNDRIEIRVTPYEKAQIISNSKKANLTITEYITKCATHKEIIVVRDLKSFITQLRKIGNNINQLTRLANGRAISCVDLSEFKEELNAIWQSLNLLIEEKQR